MLGYIAGLTRSSSSMLLQQQQQEQEQELLYGAVLAQELSDPAAKCPCHTPCCTHRCNAFTAITGASAGDYITIATSILQVIYHTQDLAQIKRIRQAFRCTIAVSDALGELTLKKL